MGTISARKTIQEIAAGHTIHPIQVSPWKKQLLDSASEVFHRGKKIKEKEEGQSKEAELFQQIGRLQMEVERIKKISATLIFMSSANWAITTTPSSVTAANASCWDCLDLHCSIGQGRCGNQRSG